MSQSVDAIVRFFVPTGQQLPEKIALYSILRSRNRGISYCDFNVDEYILFARDTTCNTDPSSLGDDVLLALREIPNLVRPGGIVGLAFFDRDIHERPIRRVRR